MVGRPNLTPTMRGKMAVSDYLRLIDGLSAPVEFCDYYKRLLFLRLKSESILIQRL